MKKNEIAGGEKRNGVGSLFDCGVGATFQNRAGRATTKGPEIGPCRRCVRWNDILWNGSCCASPTNVDDRNCCAGFGTIAAKRRGLEKRPARQHQVGIFEGFRVRPGQAARHTPKPHRAMPHAEVGVRKMRSHAIVGRRLRRILDTECSAHLSWEATQKKLRSIFKTAPEGPLYSQPVFKTKA